MQQDCIRKQPLRTRRSLVVHRWMVDLPAISTHHVICVTTPLIGKDVARTSVRELAVALLRQCFGDLLKLVQSVPNAENTLLFQKFEVVLDADQQLVHLAVSTQEYSLRANPDALVAIVSFRTGFLEDVLQLGQGLLALLENRPYAFAGFFADFTLPKPVLCTIEQFLDDRQFLT